MQRIGEHHSFNMHVACIVGERKAILLKEIYGRCHLNLTHDRNVFEGIPFTFDSARKFHLKFLYLNPKSISRWLLELENENILFSKDTFNTRRNDKTKWYTIDFNWYDLVVKGETKSLPQNEEWKSKVAQTLLKMRNVIPQNEEPIPQNEETLPSSTLSSTISSNSLSKEEFFISVDQVVFEQSATNQYQLQFKNDLFFIEYLKSQTKKLKGVDLIDAKIDEYVEEFCGLKKAMGESHATYKKWKMNFYYWMLKRLDYNNQKLKPARNDSQNRNRRGAVSDFAVPGAGVFG